MVFEPLLIFVSPGLCWPPRGIMVPWGRALLCMGYTAPYTGEPGEPWAALRPPWLARVERGPLIPPAARGKRAVSRSGIFLGAGPRGDAISSVVVSADWAIACAGAKKTRVGCCWAPNRHNGFHQALRCTRSLAIARAIALAFARPLRHLHTPDTPAHLVHLRAAFDRPLCRPAPRSAAKPRWD